MKKQSILFVVFSLLIFSSFASAIETQNIEEKQYADELIKKHHKAPASQFIDKPFLQAVASIEDHLEKFHEQMAGLRDLPDAVAKQWVKVAQQYSPVRLLVLICVTIIMSVFAEIMVRRWAQNFHQKIAVEHTEDSVVRVWSVIVAVILEAVYMGTYILVSFVLYIILIPHQQAPHLIASNYIIASYYIRLLLFVTTVVLSPDYPKLRILPYSDEVARFFYVWITFLCALEILLVRSGNILRRLQAPENTFTALVAIIIVSTAVVLIIMILKSRNWVHNALTTGEYPVAISVMPGQEFLARIWHIPALVLVLCITFIWEYRVLGSNQVLFGRVILGLLAIPFFGAFDIWGHRLISSFIKKTGVYEESKIMNEDDQEKTEHRRFIFIRYLHYVQLVYRGLLMSLMIFLLLGLWDLDIPYGRMLTGSILGVVASIFFSYLLWQIFADWVDHKIKAEIPDDDEDADEGGKGGSRIGTLLILLRKFVLSFLVILIVMFSLSAFGINIGPLIAGAGIIGLAISFGAQSLVTDIFAGIFFLVDDAFRVGDYIDMGNAKGTVEHISLRSVRLRHHLGMVQTIPFGKIDTVTNFSRDYIISKLDLRIRYDTDVDKVRKIIKRIYKEIMVDPEFGPKLTGKLKSQGIKQMDDSAMIVRVKFTTQPGEQFVMRREIFRRIQELFAENNIEFAHKKVTVYMPQQSENDLAAAGAAASALTEEGEQNSSLAGKDLR